MVLDVNQYINNPNYITERDSQGNITRIYSKPQSYVYDANQTRQWTREYIPYEISFSGGKPVSEIERGTFYIANDSRQDIFTKRETIYGASETTTNLWAAEGSSIRHLSTRTEKGDQVSVIDQYARKTSSDNLLKQIEYNKQMGRTSDARLWDYNATEGGVAGRSNVFTGNIGEYNAFESVGRGASSSFRPAPETYTIRDDRTAGQTIMDIRQREANLQTNQSLNIYSGNLTSTSTDIKPAMFREKEGFLLLSTPTFDIYGGSRAMTQKDYIKGNKFPYSKVAWYQRPQKLYYQIEGSNSIQNINNWVGQNKALTFLSKTTESGENILNARSKTSPSQFERVGSKAFSYGLEGYRKAVIQPYQSNAFGATFSAARDYALGYGFEAVLGASKVFRQTPYFKSVISEYGTPLQKMLYKGSQITTQVARPVIRYSAIGATAVFSGIAAYDISTSKDKVGTTANLVRSGVFFGVGAGTYASRVQPGLELSSQRWQMEKGLAIEDSLRAKYAWAPSVKVERFEPVVIGGSNTVEMIKTSETTYKGFTPVDERGIGWGIQLQLRPSNVDATANFIPGQESTLARSLDNTRQTRLFEATESGQLQFQFKARKEGKLFDNRNSLFENSFKSPSEESLIKTERQPRLFEISESGQFIPQFRSNLPKEQRIKQTEFGISSNRKKQSNRPLFSDITGTSLFVEQIKSFEGESEFKLKNIFEVFESPIYTERYSGKRIQQQGLKDFRLNAYKNNFDYNYDNYTLTRQRTGNSFDNDSFSIVLQNNKQKQRSVPIAKAMSKQSNDFISVRKNKFQSPSVPNELLKPFRMDKSPSDKGKSPKMFVIDLPKSSGIKKQPLGKPIKLSAKYGYTSDIRSNLFNIKGKKPSRRQVESGVFLRPMM